ncbi:hypothetical protein lerEdw1_004774 [Lerista edwardsae]|nr:hypothetical protein lerEdw1_004774 [Lerista edwardsae]
MGGPAPMRSCRSLAPPLGCIWARKFERLRRKMAEAEAQLYLVVDPEYAENVIDVGKVTFGRDANKKSNEKLEHQINNLTRAACALLNSGGGVIRAEVENVEYSLKKNGLGTKIENTFRKLIQDQTSSWYFDYKQKDSYMLIFVKTWSRENSEFPRLCSLMTGLYTRSDSCAVETKPKNAVELLQMKKGVAKRRSVEEGRREPKKARLLTDDQESSSQSSMEGEEDIRRAAANFFRRGQLVFEEILDFAESNTVEFKAFPPTEDSLAFVSRILPRYASAFANTEGGYLIFGVENSRKVIGCKRSVDPVQLKEAVERVIKSLPYFHFCTSEEKLKYEFKTLPVQDKDGESHGCVFAVRLEPFSGVVFQSIPDSWIVEMDQVTRLTVPRWIELMTAEDPDLSDLADNFKSVLSLSNGPPMVKPVYSVSDLNSLQKSLFPANSDRIAFIPQALCDQLFCEYPGLKDVLESEIQPLVQGTLMFSRSWAVDIGLPKNQDIMCNALFIAAGSHLLLFTVTKKSTANVCEHSRRTAKQLKDKLVNIGGYSHKICVVSKILCFTGEASPEAVRYPKTYCLQQEHLPTIQKSIVIVLLSFTSSLSDFLGIQFLNLLTIEQYEKISKNLRKTPRQYIYGLPGSGKTVVALKILEKIKNEFNCHHDEILYICENAPLRDFVGERGYQAVTRATFMTKGSFQHIEHIHIKHIVVDEAQNFRMEHGPWYKKAEKIVRRGAPGILWIFLDYFQMSHPYATGLPSSAKQYPREKLTTVVRNATRIYKVVKDQMENVVDSKELRIPHPVLRELLDESTCGHTTPGVCNIKKNMSWQEIACYVTGECRQYLEKGYSRRDIAILCTTEEACNSFESRLTQEMRKLRLDLNFVKANLIGRDKIVLDSIRRFSGLERPIVFGINPISSQTEVLHNLLLCLVSRANLHIHMLYASAMPV